MKRIILLIAIMGFALSGFSQKRTGQLQKLKNTEMIEWLTDSIVYEQDSVPRVFGRFVITIPDTAQQQNFNPTELYQTMAALNETVKENVFIINQRAAYNRDSLYNKQAKNLSIGKINREGAELQNALLQKAKFEKALEALNKK